MPPAPSKAMSSYGPSEVLVPARDFANLAILTPGIPTNHSTPRGAVTGIAAAGQTGRNNIVFNDRPPGIGRNSGRGDDFWQADARLSRAFKRRTATS